MNQVENQMQADTIAVPFYPQIHWIHPQGAWPSFSRDGKRIVFCVKRSDGGFSLWVMGADGSSPHLLYPPEGTTGISATRPDWSWNADRIAFAYNGEEIYTIDPNGTGAAPYYHGSAPAPGGMIYPSWNRDCESLVAVSYTKRNGAQQAELYRLTPTTFERLTTSPHPVAGRPSVSPDGCQVAFAGNEGEYKQAENQIWVVRPPEKPHRLEPGDKVQCQGRSPNWSPDGRLIVFESNRPSEPGGAPGPLAVWVIGSDGKGPVKLTDNKGFSISHPEWSRQQTQICFDGQGKGIGVIHAPERPGDAK
jgi:Tol biopolymer transport system component